MTASRVQGIAPHDLTGDQVARVLSIKHEHGHLFANDPLCACDCRENSVLLAGNGLRRRVAEARGARLNGVFQVIHELNATWLCPDAQLITALDSWRDGVAVFLPGTEVDKWLRNLRMV